MKKIIFACLAAVALVSLPGCATNDEQPVSSTGTSNPTNITTTMTPDASAPIIVPHSP